MSDLDTIYVNILKILKNPELSYSPISPIKKTNKYLGNELAPANKQQKDQKAKSDKKELSKKAVSFDQGDAKIVSARSDKQKVVATELKQQEKEKKRYGLEMDEEIPNDDDVDSYI